MKRMFLLLILLAPLLFTAGCSKDEAETPKKAPETVKVEPQPESKSRYTLSYTAAEGGSVVGVTPQSIEQNGSGSPVTALPAEGHRFTGWSDGVTEAVRTDIGIVANLAVTAEFAVKQYTLTYATGPGGELDGAPEQTVEHGGSASPVTAVPAQHHHFTGWSDGVTTPGRSDGPIKADLAVTAKFAIDQYALQYGAGEHGSLKGKQNQQVPHGGTGTTVTAVPDEGYHFVKWSDGLIRAGRTDSDITGSLTVAAEFAINQYQLKYTAGEHGTIEGDSPQQVEHGADGTEVTAVADKGYHFVAWSDGTTTAQRKDVQIRADLSVSAAFELNTYAVGGQVEGLVAGTQLVLQNNGGDDLALVADGAFSFAAKLPDDSSYEVSVLTQPRSPNQTCTVKKGTGTIYGEDVTNIQVTCELNTYTVGGTVSGLPAGNQIVLQNNAGDDLTIKADGSFTFDTALKDGSAYAVQVSAPPQKPHWTCAVEHGTGVLAGTDVTDVFIDCYPQVILQSTTGIRKIKLAWNTEDFNEVDFNLCRSKEKIPADGFGRCQKLKDGVLENSVQSPLTITSLENDVPYWFQMEARYRSGRQTRSEPIMAIPIGGLNDSGIDWCADASANLASTGTRTEKGAACDTLATGYPEQDAFSGQDAAARARSLSKKGSGSAGFDFTPICRSGEAAGEAKCPPNPMPGEGFDHWACTRDNQTGLIWEIKQESGLRGTDNTYSWYNPDKKVNGGQAGVKNAGRCTDSDCDTRAYVKAINELELCGFSDWRLPTRRELLSIVDNGRFKPAIDTRYFPNTSAAYYWTSSPYQDQENAAWQVYFLYGETYPDEKKLGKSVRLVRGKTATFGLDNPK